MKKKIWKWENFKNSYRITELYQGFLKCTENFFHPCLELTLIIVYWEKHEKLSLIAWILDKQIFFKSCSDTCLKGCMRSCTRCLSHVVVTLTRFYSTFKLHCNYVIHSRNKGNRNEERRVNAIFKVCSLQTLPPQPFLL